MAKSNAPPKERAHPEKKIGPYAGGVGVAIWLNTIETDRGSRKARSITISPRRYRDPETGDWKDSSSYFAGDLPALIFALQKAQEYVYTTPLPGDDEPGQSEDAHF